MEGIPRTSRTPDSEAPAAGTSVRGFSRYSVACIGAGGHIEVSRLLFTHGADINARCADDLTPLHIALREGHLGIGKWLLNHGADTKCQTMRGATPLHFAVDNGHLEVCRMLLEHDADVNFLQNGDGSTPLLLALESGHLSVAQLLLDHDADVHARNVARRDAVYEFCEVRV